MKPDGVTMETAEPAEVTAASEPSSTQENVVEQVPSQLGAPSANSAPHQAAPKTNGKPVTVDPKVKTKTSGSRTQSAASAGVSGSNPRPGTNSHRPVKDVKPAVPPGKKPAVTTASKTTAAVVPKKHVGVAAVSAPSRNPTRAPIGAVRPSAPTVPNGAKPANVNGTSGKKTAANSANGAKPKTAAAPARTLTSTSPKPGPSATTKPVGAAASKTTRTASGVSAPRASKPTVTTAKTAATATTAGKPAVSKTAAAPPAGRTTGTQPAKAAAAKKDVGRPPAAPAAKKPAGASALPAAKKQEASKPAAASKTSAVPKASTAAKAAEAKSKPPPPAKPAATKKPAAAGRFPPANKPLLSQTPPVSPASKPAKSSTPKGKGGAKPVQSVAPFSATKTALAAVSAPAAPEPPSTSAAAANDPAAATDEPAAAAADEPAAAATAPSPQEPPQTVSSEEAPTLQSAAPALPTPEQSASVATEPPPDLHVIDKAPPTSSCPPPAPSAVTQTAPAANLNEEEEEEEKEGSQLVSVSEMSGTTQPTEESRPGSGGPVGASAWRAGGALLSELDSEDVSGSQQGASELSAPGVLEGTESMDDLGDGSLKGAMDMEGASAGSPDFEKVPDIPVIDFDEDEDDSDRVCDMDVGSEKTDEPRRPRHDNDVDEDEEDDDDVEMASEGVTESGLESYGNADEDDFAEDERLDNLNREAPPPPPPQLPSAPAAQWDQPNPFADPWAEPLRPQQVLQPAAAEPLLGDCVAPPPTAAQAWSDAASFDPEKQNAAKAAEKCQSGKLNNESRTPEDDLGRDGKLRPPGEPADVEEGDKEEEEEPEPETLPADEVLGGSATAPTSAPSSSSTTEDEASDTEGEAQLEDSLVTAAVMKMQFDGQPLTQRCLSTVEEGVEAEESVAAAEDATPPSAASLASFGFDSATTPSNSNAQSTGESCVRSPGIFSLEELSEEAKEPPAEQQYMECRKQDADAAEEVSAENPDPPSGSQNPEENPENTQAQYYSAICEKTDDSVAALLPRRRDHAPFSRAYYDMVKLPDTPKLTCADLPPRSPARQGASPQLRRLEQHQRQLLEMQHRREQQSRPLEEAEQERKRRVEEEERRKKEEAEEEIKRNKEEQQRRELELQLQQQQQELQQRQQIMQWQQELQQTNQGQAALLSPSSGLCTIYEALESSEEEQEEEQKPSGQSAERTKPDQDRSSSSPPDSTLSSSNPSQEEDVSPLCPPESPDPPSALDLDWGQKVDIVQQLINQTLLLNGDGYSCLLPLPGGAGGTLSPLESSLWPALLPPLTPPSATVTSVSSFSPDATGSSAQGEWTVVELETHH
ncbi:protein piccolo [Oryzias melastigma]|uniref:Protein piccolo-like n=1 Tax=Oryzias melastigma TaxID=30732 RepID=A0A3B3DBZ8_ORYME|nr:protein piccolo [Oryzias melastigma]XP_024145541.1 protein piccolo [Oryzias melastigma]